MFYMNVVGYKALTLTRPKALERQFYMNVVGYKVKQKAN